MLMSCTCLCCVVKEAQTYAEDTGLLFMETSAKTAMNVNELFLAIGESFHLRCLRQSSPLRCAQVAVSMFGSRFLNLWLELRAWVSEQQIKLEK